VDALAALGREQRHDVVSERQIADALADGLDDPCALVPEHRRGVSGGIDTRSRVQIGVTHAAGDQPNEHLALTRGGEIELLHDQRSGETLQQRRADLHVAALQARSIRMAAVLTAPKSLPMV
jgi:hypothetical protein